MKAIFSLVSNLIMLIILPVTINSCIKSESCSEDKNSQIEWKKVIDYFTAKGDTIGIKATVFLMENLNTQNIKSETGLNDIDKVFLWMDSLTHSGEFSLDTMRKKWPVFFNAKTKSQNNNKISSINKIPTDFIIENIEYSILAWSESMKTNDISFENFCNYILPINVHDEPLVFWRRHLFNNLLSINDSTISLSKKSSAINQEINWFKLDYAFFCDYPGGISLDNLYKSRFGFCLHADELIVYSNRAIGIPIAFDYTPCFADRSGGHSWTSVIDNDNNSYAFSTPFIEPIKGQKLFDGKIAKVYRKTYSKQPSSLAIQNKGRETLPPMFADACIQDVTYQYPPCFDVPVTLNRRPDSTSYVYLCTFDDQAWQAIAWAHLSESDTVFFANVRPGIVFLPAYFVNNQLLPAGAPFELTESGKVKPYRTNPAKKQSMELHRKYPLFPRITMFATYMIGGIFQGANQADFSDADNLFEVEECPHQGWNTINLQNKKRYRYVRYLAPAYSWGNIAEMAFYSANNSTPALTGRPIGGKGIDDKHGAEATLDENPETWYETEALHDTYVGIDFGSPQPIGKIQFIPRTDNNGIEPGDIYELVYWDDRWVSCGIQKAKESKLVYNEVPSGGLYLLHNLTKGKEERIFTYTDGKQTWW